MMSSELLSITPEAPAPSCPACRLATALLARGSMPLASWRLARLPCPGAPARVFVFPNPVVAEPPASLWIANLRTMAIEQSWCMPDDIWVEVLRTGWAGYDFNRIQERQFTDSGGAIDGISLPDWISYSQATGIPDTLLCTLPWDGLPSMWGASFPPTMARAEALEIAQALGPRRAPSEARRPRKA